MTSDKNMKLMIAGIVIIALALVTFITITAPNDTKIITRMMKANHEVHKSNSETIEAQLILCQKEATTQLDSMQCSINYNTEINRMQQRIIESNHAIFNQLD